MDGTHNPMKIASLVFSLKNNISEYTRESTEEMKSNLSVSENLLNIIIFFVSYSFGFSDTPRF
jgi:hypothetical protein